MALARSYGVIDTYLLDLEATLQSSERRATSLDKALIPRKINQAIELSRVLKKETERLLQSMREARELVRDLRSACEQLRKSRG